MPGLRAQDLQCELLLCSCKKAKSSVELFELYIIAKLCRKGFMAITLTIDGRNHQLRIEVGSSSHSFYEVFYIPGPNGGFLAGLMKPSVFLRNLGTIFSKNLQEFGSEG